jgi:CheY-like chemotaxis protein
MKGFDWSSIRVLIVDADKDFFRLVSNILHRQKVAKVEHAVGVEEALGLLKWQSFDIIVTEYALESGNGLKFAAQMRNRKASPRLGIPIILLTGVSSETLLRKAVKAGIDHLIVKPVSPKSLYSCIERLVTHPLDVTKTKSYLGPCRRRLPSSAYTGPDRRHEGEEGESTPVRTATA